MIKFKDKVFTCPVDVTLSFIGGKWKLLLLSQLHWNEVRSYTELRDNLPGISDKMLSQQLKELEQDLLLEKKVISEKPYRVEYSLSVQGKSMSPLFDFVSQWGVDYLKANGIEYVQDQHLYK